MNMKLNGVKKEFMYGFEVALQNGGRLPITGRFSNSSNTISKIWINKNCGSNLLKCVESDNQINMYYPFLNQQCYGSQIWVKKIPRIHIKFLKRRID